MADETPGILYLTNFNQRIGTPFPELSDTFKGKYYLLRAVEKVQGTKTGNLFFYFTRSVYYNYRGE
jgi:hypothetical protein